MVWKPRERKWFKTELSYRGFNTRQAGKPVKLSANNKGYSCMTLFKRKVLLHRVLFKLYYGYEPVEVDHRDGIRTNNHHSNLVEVTHSQNCRNRLKRKDNKSGVTGVRLQKGRWLAEITVEGVTHSLGTFSRLEEAARCRMDAERKYGFTARHGK